MNLIRDPALFADALTFHAWPLYALVALSVLACGLLALGLLVRQYRQSSRRIGMPAQFRARAPIIARWRQFLARLGLRPAARVLRLEFDSDAAMLVLRASIPLLRRLAIVALTGTSRHAASRDASVRLARRIERFMRRHDPAAQLRLARGSLRVRPHADLRLTTEVKHFGDRVRIYAELRDGDARQTLFRLRYQGLPSEEDKILAEIVRRLLAAFSGAQARADRSASAGSTYRGARRPPSAHPHRIGPPAP